MYVKIIDGAVAAYPYSADALKADNPNVSFPVVLTDEMLADFNAAIVRETAEPTVDYTQNVVEGIPVLQNGVWVQAWDVSNASDTEVAARVDAQWSLVRDERNAKLASCDWTQLSDAPLSNTQTAEWATYRQALRDITTQSDPFNIVWPSEPGA